MLGGWLQGCGGCECGKVRTNARPRWLEAPPGVQRSCLAAPREQRESLPEPVVPVWLGLLGCTAEAGCPLGDLCDVRAWNKAKDTSECHELRRARGGNTKV